MEPGGEEEEPEGTLMYGKTCLRNEGLSFALENYMNLEAIRLGHLCEIERK